jgi:transcriptional regulator with XRE-family HTH domain
MLGMSQEKLGEAIGVTFQQMQKYERGANRIGASRLFEIARLLDVPIAFFYDDTDPVRAPAAPEGFRSITVDTAQIDLLHSPETIELVSLFHSIADPKIRQSLLGLAKSLSASPNRPVTATTPATAPEPTGLSTIPGARRRGRPRTRT